MPPGKSLCDSALPLHRGLGRFRFPVVVLALFLAGCGGGAEATPPDDDSPVVFHFKMRGLPGQDFRAVIQDREVKARARDQLRLPVSRRTLHVVGAIAATNGGYNLNWNWHFRGGVQLAEVSIEVCDASPLLIEQDLAFYVSQPSGVCPWASYVYAEVGPLAAASSGGEATSARTAP